MRSSHNYLPHSIPNCNPPDPRDRTHMDLIGIPGQKKKKGSSKKIMLSGLSIHTYHRALLKGQSDCWLAVCLRDLIQVKRCVL